MRPLLVVLACSVIFDCGPHPHLVAQDVRADLEIDAGEPFELTFTVRATGGPVETDLSLGGDGWIDRWFTIEPRHVDLAAGRSVEVRVHADAVPAGEVPLVVHWGNPTPSDGSCEPGGPLAEVDLVVVPPHLGIDPTELVFDDVAPGEVVEALLEVTSIPSSRPAPIDRIDPGHPLATIEPVSPAEDGALGPPPGGARTYRWTFSTDDPGLYVGEVVFGSGSLPAGTVPIAVDVQATPID